MNDASYDDPYFEGGFWQIGDPTGLVIADAAGQATVVHGMYGDGRVTFIGPLAAFRGPRLLSDHRQLRRRAVI